MTGEALFTVEMTRDEAEKLLIHLSGADIEGDLDSSDCDEYEQFYALLVDFVDGPSDPEVVPDAE
jgi:hypothetical protein